jgi:hypothetical protein
VTYQLRQDIAFWVVVVSVAIFAVFAGLGGVWRDRQLAAECDGGRPSACARLSVRR